MENKDVRWKQRFENYSKSLTNLENALNIPQPDVTQRAGIIHFFEIAFELSWNMMKDYLTEEGYSDINSPRTAIKKSFETGIINDGELWLELLQTRNLTSHIYDEKTAVKIEMLIRSMYITLLKQLYDNFRTK